MTGRVKVAKAKEEPGRPDAHLEAIVQQAQAITETWAKRHEFWEDSSHKNPLEHYDTEPGEGVSILTLCSDGMPARCLNEGSREADELGEELAQIGLYLELDDAVTANYYLIEHESALQKQFDQWAQWQWTCRLIEADTADVSGDVYQHFAEHPEDLYQLPHRDFEELISSVFTARGWKTQIGPGTADEGVDVRMWLQSPLGDALTLVQARRYAKHRPIGLEAVAALEAHSLREGASGMFVTTSRYRRVAQRFASRNKKLLLADSSDVAAWCQEASLAMQSAKAKALALESLDCLMAEVRAAGTHPALVRCLKRYPSFCLVLRETPTGALLLPIPSDETSSDGQAGYVLPVLDGRLNHPSPDRSVFRAIRTVQDGKVSYWGAGDLYSRWDGEPLGFDFWD